MCLQPGYVLDNTAGMLPRGFMAVKYKMNEIIMSINQKQSDYD